MPNEVTQAPGSQPLPSVDDAKPVEEGGPTARFGFSYQDEIAVGFLIEMLEDSSLVKVHCETHDDILLVYEGSASGERSAEFVQVKASQPDKLWSVADLCARKNGRAGTSVFEISLARDRYKEVSRFRIVTLRPVVSDLECLTFLRGAPGREPDGENFKALLAEVEKRFPGLKSPKGNGADYWLDNCLWDVRHSEASVQNQNLVRLMRPALQNGRPLLPELAEILLNEMRALAKTAADAKWEPDRDKKIIIRETLQNWWKKRTRELVERAPTPSGGNLRKKMADAGLPNELIELAVELRRDYAAAVRTSRYLESEEAQQLQRRVKAEAMSLRAAFIAGRIDLNGSGFHALCLERMDEVNADRTAGTEDRSAFLQGCLYDIADRCLLRFERPAP